MHSDPARLFIGSSSEGHDIARNLQEELHGICEVVRWDQNVFEPSGFTLPSLLAATKDVDFSVLVATPDDMTISRGVEEVSVRDNIVLEFGLFVGALGLERTYLLATGDAKMPSDLFGLTRLPYRVQSNGNIRAALNGAVLQIQNQIYKLGPLQRGSAPHTARAASFGLESEISLLCANAEAQGWTIRTNNMTTLRLRSPGGQTYALSKSQPEKTRADLRAFASKLKAGGLRVNQSILRSVHQSPFERT